MWLQPRAYNKNKSGALLFLSPRCKLQHSPHSLFPPTQHYREGESVHCDGICILGSKIIVHQIWIGSTLLAVVQVGELINDRKLKLFLWAKILEKYAWRPNFSHLGCRITRKYYWEIHLSYAKDPLDLQSTVVQYKRFGCGVVIKRGESRRTFCLIFKLENEILSLDSLLQECCYRRY